MGRISGYLTVAAVLAAMFSTPASARNGGAGFLDRLTFVIEGSYISTVSAYRHYNFISSYGYRIDRKFMDTRYRSNGEFLVHLGMNASRHLNLSLYTGCSGIYRMKWMYPVTLRATCYFGKEPMHGKWLAYIDMGPGFSGNMDKIQISGTWKLGGGYRVPLSRYTKLDFLVSARAVMTDSGAFDSGSSSVIYVPEKNLRRNDAVYLALTFGIGLTF